MEAAGRRIEEREYPASANDAFKSHCPYSFRVGWPDRFSGLAAVVAVESVDVQLGESRASLVVANETSDEALVAAVEAAGFGASPA